MTREEFIKQRCEIDKITEEEFEKRYRVVKCNCGQPYCKGYRCLDLNDLLEENQELKKQLEYLRSREYYNQLRFERDMLQYVADNGKVSKEDKEFIDMTHRNTELLEVIEEVREYIEDWLFNVGGNGASMTYEDINELLQILDKVKVEE